MYISALIIYKVYETFFLCSSVLWLIDLKKFNDSSFFFKSMKFIPLLTPSPPRKGLNSNLVQSKIISK